MKYIPPQVEVIMTLVEKGFEGSESKEGTGLPGWGFI